VEPLEGGLFAYRGNVYQIDDFPPHAEINLDNCSIPPIRAYEGTFEKPLRKKKKNKKKKQKAVKKTYIAQLYSNIGECSDVESILEN
jgi:hypothetical protein